MSVSPDQLGDIHRKIQQTFHNHPALSIRPTKGDPPEQYEITYAIEGYGKTGRGEPKITKEHRIELTIPFGFPHFPPSCKPKTDTFHPDFDPAAICLGDFWQPGSELTDLFVHIGRLINGELYSTDNAFNEEAAKWYGEHRHLFPLAEIPWRSVQAAESRGEKTQPQIDTIEEGDLASDFDLLLLDEASLGSPPIAKGAERAKDEIPAAEDLSYLQLLDARKKYCKLRQHLTDQPPRSTEAKELFARCNAAIDKAEELHRSATMVETAGNLKNATRLFLEVASIVSDFPGVENDQRRCEESLALLKKEALEQAPRTVTHLAENEHEQDSSPPPLKGVKKNGIKREAPSKEPTAVAKVASPRFSAKTLAVTLGACVALAACAYFALDFYDAENLKTAGADLARCRSDIEAQRFEEAKGACEHALSSSKPLLFFNKGKSDELVRDTNEVLASESLRQGLAGNVLIDGKFLPRKEAEALIAFTKLRKEAERLFTEEKWGEAEESYRQLLAQTEKNGGTSAPTGAIKEINDKLAFLRFAKVFAAANALIGESRWQEATAELQKAKAQLDALPEEDRQRYQLELNAAMAKCNFEEFRRLGDEFFSKADWRSAINTYKSVLPSAEEERLASRETLAELKENIARAELYAAIDLGNKAFASGNWEAAITEYNKAGTILSSHLETLKAVDAQFTRRKIDRIILQTMVIRDRQAAQTAEMDQKDPVAARNVYRQLVKILSNSAFASEEEFAEVKKSSLAAIESLDRKIYLNERERYLRDNFRQLFQQNYPAAVSENLTNAQVSFVKEAQGKLIFKMQCQETGQGRPLTLVMFYAYDKGANIWAFYSEPQ